ncbi:MAG: arginase [Desulfobacula sp.]|jgi:arginase|uniref:arginase n=1 Tax=Desulfobacula sp. TaxID=2593537 RepID=UPI001E12A89D|nr:arginase [Desulfobacula sp.]MBT3484380.1 arginase [Desulfobacula sp.]MBT3803295.1 arginase [Desulfobacula sp.]MBT4023739.1 arginase [Desulfobacula sp.]MBT4197981.1 arginase [Desulfobacula sp.]
MIKNISIIGVPMDFGQQLRGVDMGPAAVRYTGLISRLRSLGHTVIDTGDINIPIRDCDLTGSCNQTQDKNKYLNEITQICESIYKAGKAIIQNGGFPLFIGGDHSIAVGTIASVTNKEPTGLIWIDAHGDFNTPETSPSGNIHGMPLAALIGEGHPSLVNLGRPGAKIHPDNVVLIGQRDLDISEKKRLKKLGIAVFTMRDIDEQGISSVANKALMKLVHLKRIHLTVDMDALDPVEAPGVGTPVPGGISYREAHLLMEILSDSGKISSMDMVEINPILDVANKTAELAVELILSALGKSIF